MINYRQFGTGEGSQRPSEREFKFSKHVEEQDKANRMLGLIRRFYQFLDIKSIKMLFTAVVQPRFWS